ncbi:DUF6884 domain-containing protein [Halococcoides cellulosivorans]|uniref:DUF6884 domain-containing protein n=1 Tax=Halococcoides cellulosivorans TaxID=1679096 RepID=A0A2R4X472_9EURY|nr:DUF6884 domain-containing protein [Halococcoides cellulosivorans]AWB28503.1 hypothetical protein HARCEL1_12740 [Halococcoides cellulosivorans]
MTTRLAIVGCSQSKHDPDEWGKAHPDHEEGDDVDVLPLRHLYKRSYWVVKLRYARLVADDWRILSAGLGLANPDRPMEDSYDRTITEMTDEEIEAWVEDVGPDIRSFVERHWDENVVIDVLLGQRYLEPIQHILEDLPAEVVYPFEGTAGNGEQMSRLKELVEQYRDEGSIDLERAKAAES